MVIKGSKESSPKKLRSLYLRGSSLRNSEDEEWRKRYFARYFNEKAYAWKLGATSFSVDSDGYVDDWKYVKLYEGEEM